MTYAIYFFFVILRLDRRIQCEATMDLDPVVKPQDDLLKIIEHVVI